MSKRENAIRLMNELGSRREPFLFVVDFEMNEPMILTLQQAEDIGLSYDINHYTNCRASERPQKELTFKKRPVPFDEYRQAFEKVIEQLHQGNSYLVNLTFPTKIDISLTLEEILWSAQAKYKLLLRDSFVVFSPEAFVQIRDGIISSFPMKGTIDAGLDDAEEKILNDSKEIAEHSTVVDLIRNDLSSVAKQVRVEQFRYIDHVRTNVKHLLQVSSKITGRLPPDYHRHIGMILFTLLPAGSVTGAPKKKTVEIIRAIESSRRGYYTGVAGYFDGENLDSGVMIRYIEQTRDGLVFKSGGGITVFSNDKKEYEEMVDKVYINPRHHSLAFIQGAKTGVHHFMVEMLSLDDVGHAYDVALENEAQIGTTLGRHSNDWATSFYVWTPSKFLIEYGWGGRLVDDATWQVKEMKCGPSMWGHERNWLPPEGRAIAKKLRDDAAAVGMGAPVQVSSGYFTLADVPSRK